MNRDRSDLVIIGDFNIDYTNKQLLQSSGLVGLETKYSLTQLIKHHTRISNESRKTIDLIYTDMKNISKSGVVNYNVSDHLPIFHVKKKIRTKIVKKTTYGRSYKRYNRETFLRLMENQNWENYFEVNDLTILWDVLMRNISQSLDTLCPIKPLTVVDCKPGWLSNAILLQMRERDKAFRKARRTKLHADWDRAKQIRNELSRYTTNIKTAKSYFIRTKLENNKNNPRKFWKQINELLPNTKGAEVLELQDELTLETFNAP